jgi:hypothetical protein
MEDRPNKRMIDIIENLLFLMMIFSICSYREGEY